MKAAACLCVGLVLSGFAPAAAQPQGRPRCRFVCAPEFKVEPTITFTNLFGGPRVLFPDGRREREKRAREFEVILSTDLPTRVPWLGFTVEGIFLPFEDDSTPELEFETNLTWLAEDRTGGWVSSHVDIVDKFSPAERPGDSSAYTHKLNFELDTALHLFKWLQEGQWLRGVEIEASLDYVATGLPRSGDAVGGITYAGRASPWSLSVVLVLPIASPEW